MMTRNHRSRPTLTAAILAVLALAVTSCLDHDEPLLIEPEGGALFDRYVSLGSSITAGFQSGGINIDFQREAYPVVLAGKAGASFGIPGLALPGCPPPLVGPLTSTRTSTTPCGLRLFAAPAVVQNLAVPAAAARHLGDPIGTGSTLNTLILGGRTQLQAMREADPSLVSVWIGNNDVLGASLLGDTLALTPLASFQSEYDEITSAVQSTGPMDAVLIGVVNPLIAAPALQPGAYFWALAQNPPPGLPNLAVSNNCAPFQLDGSPNPGGARLVSFLAVAAQIEAGADPVVIDCSLDAPGLVNEIEQVTIATRIGAFNAYIQQQAADNGWIYVDPNAAMAPALMDPAKFRNCQLLATATDAASFAAAVVNSCPVDLDPGTPATFFGSFVSHDGIHPTGAFHAAFADTLAGRLNEVHGLSLPTS